MSSQTTPISLPTLDRLKSKAPDASVEANPLAQKWLGSFSEALEKNDLTAIEKLFLEDALWRDFLALTWDLRSFNTWSNIEKLLKSSEGGLRNPKVLDEVHNKATISSLFPDLCILQFAFDYDTPAGKGSGIVRLVPVGDSGEWKAWTVFTCFETFTNSSPKVGINRSNVPTAESWDAIRQRQIDLVEGPPEVLIIGGAQAGLSIAARLKALGVRSLVAERHARIGDSWRKRYDALCTHDTVWFDHLAYMPFPANWPVYSAAGRLANWLEAYSEAMELSVWTSSEVQKAAWNGADKTWAVTIRRNESEPQVLTVKHVVFATGFGGGIGQSPTIAGEDTFKGKILHSSSFKSSRDYAQQKAVVVGACNSAHDIAQDLIAHGVDVTIYQRSSTYVISNKAVAMLLQGLYNENSNLDFSDRANASLPWEATKLVHQRVAPHIASTMDKETLDGLAKVGFHTNLGPGNAGIFPLLFSRGGGYYIDVGGSKDIIDGRIKLKTGSAIKNFTPTGLEFEDGTQLNVDLVVFATGYGDSKDVIESICGPEITSKIPSVWGLDQEGELKSVWRPLAQENLWVAVGNLQMCRFYSNLLALQIKGSLEGLLPKKVA